MKLSRREKVLLGILAVLLLVFVGWRMLVGPAIEEHNTLVSSVENLTFQKSQMDATIAGAATIHNDLAEAWKTMDTESYFYRDLNAAEVDRLLSEFAAKNSVTIVEMEIAPAEAAVSVKYSPSVSVLDSTLREQRMKFDLQAAQSYYSEIEGIFAAEDENPITVPLYRCTLTVSGRTANVAAMADAINSAGRSIYVTAIGAGYGSDNIEGGVFKDTFSVNVYFLED